MFTDRILSIEIMEDLLAINTLVNESLLKAKNRASEKEFIAYRRIISKMMILSFDVLPEIWRRHPEICPKEFRPDNKSVSESDPTADGS
jgi:hypothetical protein